MVCYSSVSKTTSQGRSGLLLGRLDVGEKGDQGNSSTQKDRKETLQVGGNVEGNYKCEYRREDSTDYVVCWPRGRILHKL